MAINMLKGHIPKGEIVKRANQLGEIIRKLDISASEKHFQTNKDCIVPGRCNLMRKSSFNLSLEYMVAAKNRPSSKQSRTSSKAATRYSRI